jgi:hypothetical protein
MARKSTQDDDSDESDDASSQKDAEKDTKLATKLVKRNPLKYITIIAVAVVAIIIAYNALFGSGGKSLSSKQIFSNVSSSKLNQTQSLFVNDLERSENVSSLQVSYYSSNSTQYITQSSNLTIAITSNQTIDSYKLGDYNKTVITGTVAYTNAKNGTVIAKNMSSVYYYNTNTTVTCFNDTTYSSASVTNSSLQCASGDQGLSYLEETPFTAANVSALSYLVFNNTVTYSGTRSIAGRECDYFIISNETASNLQSNYTVYDLCIDTQYGIPLYVNATDVVGGVPSSFGFTATAVSANVSGSEFVIPQQYLSSISHSII